MDRRRAPRRHIGSRHAPDLCAGLGVEGREERVLLHVGLDDDHAVVEDRRAARLPLHLRRGEPAGVEHAEILLPELFALQVVRIQPFGSEERDQPLAVGRERRVGVGRLGVPLDLRHGLEDRLLPLDLRRYFLSSA